ncbi:MAG: bacteriohemerythrin [Rhodospirillales bacterium]
MFLEWRNEYDVGHAVIDYDHRNLCNLINALHRDSEAGLPPERIAATFAILSRYVEEHFAREEKLFENTGYPDEEAHKRRHEKIAKRIQTAAELFQRYPDGFDTEDFLEFLRTWLTGHILRTDQGYLPYIDKAA